MMYDIINMNVRNINVLSCVNLIKVMVCLLSMIMIIMLNMKISS